LESKTIAPILPRILRESISKLDGTLNSLKSTPGEFGSRLQQKINLVFAKNPDLHIVKQISLGIFENRQLKSEYENLVKYFDDCSLTIGDVERSFSIFKDLLTPKRNRLTEENLEKLVIINANKSILCNKT
jgi:hypothetical protein